MFSKKNVLLNTLPEGLVVNRVWLEKHGLTRPDIDYYLRSGWLHAVHRGFYRKPGGALKWQHLAYSFQELGYLCHVGGKTALAEKGFSHYLELGQREIQLFSEGKLPIWLTRWHECQQSDFRFSLVSKTWLADLPESLFWFMPFGGWDWPIKIAQPELALVEWLSLAKTEVDLRAIDSVFEGLTTLSPHRMRLALIHCDSIQTRRLLGWFCDRYPHTWCKRLDWGGIDLGKGKRSYIMGGAFNVKWQITVPKGLDSYAHQQACYKLEKLLNSI